VEIDTKVLSGPPAETISEAAAAPDVDLVVAGSRGQGAVARALLGSVTDRLVHVCPKPILVVH
jgi:nucleotide-binding universal stress UspA family protein